MRLATSSINWWSWHATMTGCPERRQAVCQRLDALEVQMAGGLVQHQHIGVRHHHAAEHAAHLFAARKHLGGLVHFVAAKRACGPESRADRSRSVSSLYWRSQSDQVPSNPSKNALLSWENSSGEVETPHLKLPSSGCISPGQISGTAPSGRPRYRPQGLFCRCLFMTKLTLSSTFTPSTVLLIAPPRTGCPCRPPAPAQSPQRGICGWMPASLPA